MAVGFKPRISQFGVLTLYHKDVHFSSYSQANMDVKMDCMPITSKCLVCYMKQVNIMITEGVICHHSIKIFENKQEL